MAAGYRFVTMYARIIPALLPTPENENDIAQFVGKTITLAPFHLRMGVRIVETTLLFWLLFTVKGFLGGTPERAGMSDALARFEKLSNPTATLIRLYRSLAMLAWAERKDAS